MARPQPLPVSEVNRVCSMTRLHEHVVPFSSGRVACFLNAVAALLPSRTAGASSVISIGHLSSGTLFFHKVPNAQHMKNSAEAVVILLCLHEKLTQHIRLLGHVRRTRRRHIALLVLVHVWWRMGVVVVHAKASILLALLAEQIAERELAAHRRRRSGLCLFRRLLDSVFACLLLGLTARPRPICNLHHLLSRLDTAVRGRRGRRVREDPDAVDLVALQDDIGIRYLHLFTTSELVVEIVESAAVEDDGAVALGADGRGRELADEQRALDTHLLPLLRIKVEGVERGIGRHMFDGGELRPGASQDGEVELFVGARGRQRHVECGGRRVSLVVGRLRGRCGGVLVGAPSAFVRRHVGVVVLDVDVAGVGVRYTGY
jgi:hypothetical protein